MNLNGRVALVTGAGSGIGQAAAIRLAADGARVGALGLRAEDVAETVSAIQRSGGEAIALGADISHAEPMEAAVAELVEKWGGLQIVFANAGINGVWAPLEDLQPNEWDETMAVNLRGTFLTVRAALPHLKQDGGSIIITASINGTRIFSNTGATAYACSKAAQVAFAKMIAVELGRYHIRVNVLCPGSTETNINDSTEMRNLKSVRIPVHYPERRIPLTGHTAATPSQIADLVHFFASDASSHITGTEVYIDGGESLLQG
jgi:NAD(P)-dependent dehydrogenase (short-subunit alcohol dehydrogenase family)